MVNVGSVPTANPKLASVVRPPQTSLVAAEVDNVVSPGG
jgi:hypothetical protein